MSSLPESVLSSRAVPTLRAILSGGDSVYMHWKVPLDVGEVGRLHELRAMAQEAKKGKESEPTVRLGGQVFLVLSSRGRKGEYVLDSEFMTIVVEPDPLPGMQTISADIKSICLNQVGLLGAQSAAQKVALDLAAENADDEQLRAHVTRFDFFMDVQGWKPRPRDLTPKRASWYEDRNPDMYTRARKFQLVGESRFESAVYGKKSSGISAEIYNKTLEIEAHPEKAWFRKVWEQNPEYDANEDVTRIEFRVRREGLTELHEEGAIDNLSTFEDVYRNMRAIWIYLTSKWLVMRGQRTKTKRNTVAVFWQQIVDGGDFHQDGTRAVLRGHFDRIALDALRAFAGYLVLGHACIQWFDRNQRLTLQQTAPRLLEDAIMYIENTWKGGWRERTAKKLSRWSAMTHLQLMGEDVEEAA